MITRQSLNILLPVLTNLVWLMVVHFMNGMDSAVSPEISGCTQFYHVSELK